MAATAKEVWKPGGQNFDPGATNVACAFMSVGCREGHGVSGALTEMHLCHSDHVTAA